MINNNNNKEQHERTKNRNFRNFRIYRMQYVTHDEFTQKSTMSITRPGPIVSNGSSTSDDFLDLVLWN